MRFKELIVEGEKIVGEHRIVMTLEQIGFNWLIDSEIENACCEIKNNTLIWHSGDFISGNWHYGIFKSGNFYGNFKNGIFEGTNFKGKFLSGVKI